MGTCTSIDEREGDLDETIQLILDISVGSFQICLLMKYTYYLQICFRVNWLSTVTLYMNKIKVADQDIKVPK